MTEPPIVNVVLTFRDADGRRWLSGAMLGPLCPEDGDDELVTVEQMKDRALLLVHFAVVEPQLTERTGP